MEPLVSIIIPVYNGGNYMDRAIDSALSQDYGNTEVLVINDGSNDAGATDRIAETYGNRIRYFKKSNGGVSSALNLGIRNMRGAYFSWLSHDDEYLPFKISSQMRIMEKAGFPDDRIVYSDFQYIDQQSRVIGKRMLFPSGVRERILPVFFSRINGCTLLIPKKQLEAAGGFDESLKTTQDYDCWAKLSRSCVFEHQRLITTSSREHEAQGGRTIPTAKDEASDFFIKLIGNITPSQKEELDGFSKDHLLMLYVSMKQKNYGKAAALLESGIAKNWRLAYRTKDRAWNSEFSPLSLFVHPCYSMHLLSVQLPVYIRKRFYR